MKLPVSNEHNNKTNCAKYYYYPVSLTLRLTVMDRHLYLPSAICTHSL